MWHNVQEKLYQSGGNFCVCGTELADAVAVFKRLDREMGAQDSEQGAQSAG